MALGTRVERVGRGKALVRICAGVAAALLDAELGFDELMRRDLGEVVSAEPGREVRRVKLPASDGTTMSLVLKRNREPTPLSWVLKKLVRGRVQHSRTWSEAEALVQLWRAGFPVNEPVAWGERRRLGVPVEGFLLVREVAGTEAAKVWTTAGPRLRERLLENLGAVVGRLHRARFPECVRIKDVFCCEVPSDAREPIPFFLIDREMSRGRQRRVTPNTLTLALARSYIGFLALNAEPTLRQLVRFHAAYVAQVPELAQLSTRAFFARVGRDLSRIAGEAQRFADTVARSRWATRLPRASLPRIGRRKLRHPVPPGHRASSIGPG